MFFTVVKHNEKRHKLFSKCFRSGSFTETKRALTKSEICWALVARLLAAFCVTSVPAFSLDSFLSVQQEVVEGDTLTLRVAQTISPLLPNSDLN